MYPKSFNPKRNHFHEKTFKFQDLSSVEVFWVLWPMMVPERNMTLIFKHLAKADQEVPGGTINMIKSETLIHNKTKKKNDHLHRPMRPVKRRIEGGEEMGPLREICEMRLSFLNIFQIFYGSRSDRIMTPSWILELKIKRKWINHRIRTRSHIRRAVNVLALMSELVESWGGSCRFFQNGRQGEGGKTRQLSYVDLWSLTSWISPR